MKRRGAGHVAVSSSTGDDDTADMPCPSPFPQGLWVRTLLLCLTCDIPGGVGQLFGQGARCVWVCATTTAQRHSTPTGALMCCRCCRTGTGLRAGSTCGWLLRRSRTTCRSVGGCSRAGVVSCVSCSACLHACCPFTSSLMTYSNCHSGHPPNPKRSVRDARACVGPR